MRPAINKTTRPDKQQNQMTTTLLTSKIQGLFLEE